MAARKKQTNKRKTSPKRRTTSKVGSVSHTPIRRKVRRKKIGAIPQSIEYILGAVAGSFVTRIVERNMPAPATTTSSDFRPYAGLVLGAAAAFLGNKKKNILIESIGVGAIVEGSRSLITSSMIPNLTGSTTAFVGSVPMTIGNNRNPNRVRMLQNGNRMSGIHDGQALIGSGKKNKRGIYGVNSNGYSSVSAFDSM